LFVVVTIIGVVIAIDAVIDGVFVILGIDGVFVILAIVVGIVFFTFVLVGLKTIDVLRNKSGF
jgi:hypothetical protein